MAEFFRKIGDMLTGGDAAESAGYDRGAREAIDRQTAMETAGLRREQRLREELGRYKDSRREEYELTLRDSIPELQAAFPDTWRDLVPRESLLLGGYAGDWNSMMSGDARLQEMNFLDDVADPQTDPTLRNTTLQALDPNAALRETNMSPGDLIGNVNPSDFTPQSLADFVASDYDYSQLQGVPGGSGSAPANQQEYEHLVGLGIPDGQALAIAYDTDLDPRTMHERIYRALLGNAMYSEQQAMAMADAYIDRAFWPGALDEASEIYRTDRPGGEPAGQPAGAPGVNVSAAGQIYRPDQIVDQYLQGGGNIAEKLQQEARAAIEAGKDPEAVNQRMNEIWQMVMQRMGGYQTPGGE